MNGVVRQGHVVARAVLLQSFVAPGVVVAGIPHPKSQGAGTPLSMSEKIYKHFDCIYPGIAGPGYHLVATYRWRTMLSNDLIDWSSKMNIKSLLLGSAAALAAVSGAQAADAIVAAEPEPMEYVRVCDAYGTGYFYIPGT
ncbi:porin, partial [Rhizobium sp. YJ-22]|uniref:porin n=2 Tax=Rhizobium sp. YJ-22 TaxID=3037556 RepID=UPI002412BA57